MCQISRQENINLQHSSIEFEAIERLVFPELREFKLDGADSESNIARLLNIDTKYALPALKKEEPSILEEHPTLAKYNERIVDITKLNLVITNTVADEVFNKAKDAKEKKQRFLYYFFIRLLWNFYRLSAQTGALLKISVIKDFDIEALISETEDFLLFKPSSLNKYLINLIKLESLIAYTTDKVTVSKLYTQAYLMEQSHKLYYPIYFKKLKTNSAAKLFDIVIDWGKGDYFRKTAKYFDFKIRSYQLKLNKVLRDKVLVKHLLKSFFFLFPKRLTKKNRKRKLKRILRIIKTKKLSRMVARIFKRLLDRRKLLWMNIRINMVRRGKRFLIGKDYRIYRKKVTTSYPSQKSKLIKTLSRGFRLNAKFIKCIELAFPRKLMKRMRNVLNTIYKINVHLHYFVNRFPKKYRKSKRVYLDPRFVIPYKSKILSFEETFEILANCKKQVKQKIFDTILFKSKHKIEKHFLGHLKKRRERSFEYFVGVLEKEKYYAQHRKTKFTPVLTKWLNKYIKETINHEFPEYFSRPRVTFDKREQELEDTYPYFPRTPLLLQRDLKARSFKETKENKFYIIRLTKPRIIMQSSLLKHKSSYSMSNNLLRLKLGSKLSIPERVERIHRSCKKFYNNLLKNHTNLSFRNLFIKLKAYFLMNPELKTNPKYVFLYLLTIYISPLFNGINEEREYAKQLQVFLNNYLVRIRIYHRYDTTRLFTRLKQGYVRPDIDNLYYLLRFYNKARALTKKKPNYTIMKFMHRRALKRLSLRIRSKIAVSRGLLPLFKYNLVATDHCAPINIKKNFKNKGYHYLFQPDVNKKAKAKYKYYFTALKRSFGYSMTYHTNARFYYYTPFNLFLQDPETINIDLADGVMRYNRQLNKTNQN